MMNWWRSWATKNCQGDSLATGILLLYSTSGSSLYLIIIISPWIWTFHLIAKNMFLPQLDLDPFSVKKTVQILELSVNFSHILEHVNLASTHQVLMGGLSYGHMLTHLDLSSTSQIMFFFLGGVLNTFFIFTPAKMIQFDEHIFQRGWFNHQLGFFLGGSVENMQRMTLTVSFLMVGRWRFLSACDLSSHKGLLQ